MINRFVCDLWTTFRVFRWWECISATLWGRALATDKLGCQKIIFLLLKRHLFVVISVCKFCLEISKGSDLRSWNSLSKIALIFEHTYGKTFKEKAMLQEYIRHSEFKKQYLVGENVLALRHLFSKRKLRRSIKADTYVYTHWTEYTKLSGCFFFLMRGNPQTLFPKIYTV